MEQHSQVPKFREGDNKETIPHSEALDNAKTGKKESNDPQDFIKSEAPGKKESSERDVSRDDSPLHTSSVDKKDTVESSPKAPKGRYEQQLSREEGRRSTDSAVPHDSGVRRSSYDSPRHSGLSAGDTPRKVSRQNVGSDRSVEQSPLHPHSQGKIGGQVTSSPSWERKVSSEGSHVQATSTPTRSRLRSVNRGDETPDHGPAVPKFGAWDDNDPASAEGFTQIFSLVQEEKQTGGGKVPIMPSESSYSNGQMRDGHDNSKGCFCIPWGRR